eukprot:403351262
MGIPILKIMNLFVSVISEPAANLLKLMIRNQKLMHGFFVMIGNRANVFEVKLNYKTAHPKERLNKVQLEVPPLEPDDAFVKGVDYFIEVILFYGFIGIWSMYEINKIIKNSQKAQERSEKMKIKNKYQELEIQEMKEEIKLLKEEIQQQRLDLQQLKKL